MTAIKQTIEKLEKMAKHMPPRSNLTIGLVSAINLLRQQTELEKQQIVDAFDMGCKDQNRIGEEYYNETYGTN